MSVNIRWRRVNANEARALLERPNLKVFDMRDQQSFAQGHIEGAQYLSNNNLEEVILKTPRHDPVLIYCYHGNASQTGAKVFTDFGFQEVYDLVGGYEGWCAGLARATPELCVG
ncbi:MAG: putative thiosulfate sulfurtransferase rhodanese-like domain/ankyrin repeat [Proteobacteria bacterium]|nr:putative thiosulfate sulfurtransferase rhodanese-like domain/ankyrin repeat [Pseudomonadota bacterium]